MEVLLEKLKLIAVIKNNNKIKNSDINNKKTKPSKEYKNPQVDPINKNNKK
jgi:hypothetical protein